MADYDIRPLQLRILKNCLLWIKFVKNMVCAII